MTKVVGVLLAGGRSIRFGREKAVAPFGGGLLMEGPLQALAGVCDEVAVAAKADSGAAAIAETAGYAVLSDPEGAPNGPLAGVLAGLGWAKAQGASHLATAPCDAARLTADQLAQLIALAKTRSGAVVAASRGGLEPLMAVWPVDAAYALVGSVLKAGDHPAVRTLLAELDLAVVEGFDSANVNEAPELAALDSPAIETPPAHARLFRFEDDFVRTLRCIPMCVRFKLDRTSIKLSLRQWSRFTLADRLDLRLMPCETSADVETYREALIGLIRARAKEEPKALAEAPPPGWLSPTTPEAVQRLAAEQRVAPPSDSGWASLSELERYAIVKLTRDRHENANFVPAMEEFGLA